MKQPPSPNSAPNPAAAAATDAGNNAGKKRPPSPEEVLVHYESQGLETRGAALKAIGELQTLLHKSLNSRHLKKDRFTSDALRRLDNANARLAVIEMKLDSKPDVGQSIAIGLASGALLQGVGAVLPQVMGGLRSMWNSVQAVTRASTHSD